MNSIVRTKILILFALISLSLQARKTSNSNTREFSLPNDQDAYEVSVPKGEDFAIKIRGNPTTGYGWFLDNPKQLEGSSVEALNLNDMNSAEYVADDHPNGMVGVGGYYYFKFKAVGDANTSTNLTFIHKRPWETTNLRTAVVTVKITPSQ